MQIYQWNISMYDYLAKYYDALVKDDIARDAWTQLISKHLKKGRIKELACGSGEITMQLANAGYEIYASDCSASMLEIAKKKDPDHLVHWQQNDMRNWEDTMRYDGILCLCDSINYIVSEKELLSIFKNIHKHLQIGGVMIIDMHAQSRINEFQNTFHEVGKINGIEYEWMITSDAPYIYQSFIFHDTLNKPHQEQHMQRVFDPQWVYQQLCALTFKVDVVTDFIKPGIQTGEKHFFIARKETL